MAVTWTPTITPLNIATKEASISAVRLEAVDTDEPTEEELASAGTYNVPLALLATSNQKLAVANELWAAYQADVTQTAAVAAFVDQLEIDLKANLEARE